ncbi:MAG: L-ribulose-5-phosphate 3-epimerase [Abditibacteriota bacterium]|nr:L-ribulose-5-phosphate 3-epimerase [Abditibacteriota bacterium]
MKNLISCRPESFGPYHARAFEALQKLGITNVEIAAPTPEQVEATIAELEKYGLSATSVTLGSKWSDADFLDRTRDAAAAAQKLGARIIFTSQNAGDAGRESAYEVLRSAGDVVAEYGVTLVLETHPDLCQNATQALETIRGINHPNVRINFDPANVYYYNEGVDAIAELRQVVEVVGAAHLKDTNGGYKTWHFPAIGEGVVDWPTFFSILNESGLSGPFTLEIEGIEGEKLSYEETYERVEKSVTYLRATGLMS